jgi:hypothetical protein
MIVTFNGFQFTYELKQDHLEFNGDGISRGTLKLFGEMPKSEELFYVAASRRSTALYQAHCDFFEFLRKEIKHLVS